MFFTGSDDTDKQYALTSPSVATPFMVDGNNAINGIYILSKIIDLI